MEKLRRVLSGQDDEEQGLTAQVAGRGGDGRGREGTGGARARLPASREESRELSGFSWGLQKP